MSPWAAGRRLQVRRQSPHAARFVRRLSHGAGRCIRPARLAGRRAAQTVRFLGARVGAPGEEGLRNRQCSEGRLAALALLPRPSVLVTAASELGFLRTKRAPLSLSAQPCFSPSGRALQPSLERSPGGRLQLSRRTRSRQIVHKPPPRVQHIS